MLVSGYFVITAKSRSKFVYLVTKMKDYHKNVVKHDAFVSFHAFSTEIKSRNSNEYLPVTPLFLHEGFNLGRPKHFKSQPPLHQNSKNITSFQEMARKRHCDN